MVIYTELLAAASQYGETAIDFLRAELPHVWYDAYLAMTPDRPPNVSVIRRGTFDYLYDDYDTLQAAGVVSSDVNAESRVVAVIGISAPEQRRRDDSRLRGWLGPTEDTFGKAWDKGHFIAHSIGGAVQGWELNVFLQRRDVNRGWSHAGRRYRAMEKYCSINAGVLCWSRPTYTDGSAMPSQIELGILKTDGELWTETFENAYAVGEFSEWLTRLRSIRVKTVRTTRS